MKKAIVVFGVACLIGLAFVSYVFWSGATKNSKAREAEQVPHLVGYLPKGSVIGYEMFRGVKCPLLSDGEGGMIRWIADVPWDNFTIEEKLSMALAPNSATTLNVSDIYEIARKYASLEPMGDGEPGYIRWCPILKNK